MTSALAAERLAYRRSRSRRSTLVALASTVVFAGVLGLVLTRSPGWPRVQETFLDPAAALASLPRVVEGLWLNVRVLAVAEIGILGLGLVIAVLRTLRGPVFFPLRALATGVPTGTAVLGCVALILVYRVGAPSQGGAARSLGLTHGG